MVTPGDSLTHYEILEPLGKGGMGQVFLAHDTSLDRKVAIKFLFESAQQDPHMRQRFLREAKSAAALEHPFICQIYEAGEEDGNLYIAMEYVEGETLAKRLKEGPLPLDEALQAGLEIAEALEVAHDHGVIHRDLKPSNIMLTPQGHAKVMDFGLAKRLAAAPAEDSEARTLTDDNLTQTGIAVGTLAYMSPEQTKGREVDARSDIFSFAVVLYEMITGEHPFKRDSALETLSAILRDPPSTAQIKVLKGPAELFDVFRRSLAKDPTERYAKTSQLTGDLRELRNQVAVPRGRRLPLSAAVALVALVALLATGWWMTSRKGGAPTADSVPEPMSVLIADFDNKTGDAIFDGALEAAMAIGLEEAPFINSYKRGRARGVAEQIEGTPTTLNGETARLVAQREAISVVVVGSITPADPGYLVSVDALDALTGEAIASRQTEVDSRDGVLPAIAELAVRVRRALGDAVPESVDLAADETFTTASLDAARAYAQGQELMAIGKWQEAVPVYQHAIQLDPDFGRAYAGLAVCYLNLNQLEDSKKYYEEAFSRIDRMTDREKYRTRGGYYLLTRNYEKAAEEYEALVSEYPSDPAGPANLAFAYFFGRDMPRTLEIGRQAVEAHPENTLIRANLALYAMYAGDFETAAQEAEIVLESNPSYETAYVPAAMALIDQADFAGAGEVYDRLRQVSPWGASLAATGAADLALFQGRLSEAANLLEQGIASDNATELDAEAARKLMMLARVRLHQGDEVGAGAATEEALSLTRRRNILFAAARILVETGRNEDAIELASELAGQLEPEPQVFAKLIEGQVALAGDEPQQAITLFRQAQELIDTWIGRFLLGQAYLAAEAYAEAYSEFEACLKRRGEATSLFLDDVASYHYFPAVYYWLGRAQEGLGSPAAADSYRIFLGLKDTGDGEPLVTDARRRLDAG